MSSSIQISDLYFTQSSLPVDSGNQITELWEELNEKQLRGCLKSQKPTRGSVEVSTLRSRDD
jgi:hypothetical protein